jgi:diguanylate cyclase (GGDEF)-like protein/PAS domain S-box-containing protein
MGFNIENILDNISDAVFALDTDSNFVYLNSQAEKLFDKSKDNYIGKCVWDEFPYIVSTSFYHTFQSAVKDQTMKQIEDYFVLFNKWFQVRVYPNKDSVLLYICDITQNKINEIKMYESTEQFRAIFEHSAMGIGVVDLNGRPIKCNNALLDMLGYSFEEISAMTFADLTYPMDVFLDLQLFNELKLKKRNFYRIEKRYIHKNGKIFWARLTVSPIYDEEGTPLYIVSTMEDINETKLAQEKLRELAEKWERLSIIDELTQLHNRRFFEWSLKQEWDHCLRNRIPLSLILIDIDWFKAYNDTYGHQQGDKCIKQVANAINNSLAEIESSACRYGGEEFAIILPDCNDIQSRLMAEMLRKNIESLNIFHGGHINSKFITISLGTSTMIPELHSSCHTLLSMADSALYRAKQLGRNQVKVYGA